MKEIHPHDHVIGTEDYENLLGQAGVVLWFTGLSGSGKSTIANELQQWYHKRGLMAITLDGDNIRNGLCGDLGFSDEDRKENIRRISHVAKLMADRGIIVITAFISPFEEDRQEAKAIIGDRFREVYVATPLEICESRDPKGLYEKARRGEIPQFTGISSPYEVPQAPDHTLNTEGITASEIAAIFGKDTLNDILKPQTITI